MPSRTECPMKSEAQLAIYMDKHESTSQAEVSCTAVPSIEELGKQIVVLVEAGDKAKSQSNDRFTNAGLMLIEAKSRVPNFKAFLRDHCNGLRVLAAQRLGMPLIPVIPVSHLSEAEKRGFIVADNKLSEQSVWDPDVLRQELQFFSDLDIDFEFSVIGFETAEVDA